MRALEVYEIVLRCAMNISARQGEPKAVDREDCCLSRSSGGLFDVQPFRQKHKRYVYPSFPPRLTSSHGTRLPLRQQLFFKHCSMLAPGCSAVNRRIL